MSDYIAREAVLKLHEDGYLMAQTDYERVKWRINNIPAADVVPVKHGKWEHISHKQLYGYKCSECGAIYNRKKRRLNYCPNCGADMMESKQESKQVGILEGES